MPNRDVVQAASNESWIATLGVLTTTVGALIVGLGIITNPQESILVATTTPAIAVAGVIASAIHNGNIEPSAITAALAALVVQIGADLVAFLPNWSSTVSLVIPVVMAVALGAAQIAHALFSRKVPA